MSMSVVELRDRLIEEGKASILATENREVRILGGLNGFEICRSLETPQDFQRVIKARTDHEHKLRNEFTLDNKNKDYVDKYWLHRYATAQVEYVYSILCVGWKIYPLNCSAVMKYAQIVGVADA